MLSDFDGLLPNMQIGNIGALCRHQQAVVCRNETAPTPAPTPSDTNGATLGPAPSATLPIAAIAGGITLVLVFVMIAVAAQ